jgi:predicted AAA+ superfamily ATPase
MEIEREQFLDALSKYRDPEAIKVLTGIRRCGKSTLLKQYIERLRSSRVPDDRIFYVNMESLTNARFRDGMVLYEEIMQRKGDRLYIFLDEVQSIEGWERVVNSLRMDMDCDIYITGSNAYLPSTEISTLLTGRSIQMRVLPLSFKEFCLFERPTDVPGMMRAYSRYVDLGGFPFIRPEMDEEVVLQRLEEIKSDIILKDICSRKEKIDSVKVRRVVDYMFSEIGNPISAENISANLGISQSAANEYLRLITDSLLFFKVERYDLRGKTILKTMPKFYCTDLGMRNTQPIPVSRDGGRVMENIVCLELIRRGYRVYVGKIGDYEIDFIARKGKETEFYQVVQSVADNDTMERELRPFRSLRAQGRRFLITSDATVGFQTEEATIIGIMDFLTL